MALMHFNIYVLKSVQSITTPVCENFYCPLHYAQYTSHDLDFYTAASRTGKLFSTHRSTTPANT